MRIRFVFHTSLTLPGFTLPPLLDLLLERPAGADAVADLQVRGGDTMFPFNVTLQTVTYGQEVASFAHWTILGLQLQKDEVSTYFRSWSV